ncbi:MAG: hypothetical protein K8T91_22960 [Planctomycetes bacterium]|nr:hypothetical protein [Planctomycetota bacterium]
MKTFVGIFFVVGLLCGAVTVAAEDQTVGSKPNSVGLNNEIDYGLGDTDPTQAETITPNGDSIDVLSKTFVPPSGKVFVQFGNKLPNGDPTHVDVWKQPDGLNIIRIKDNLIRMENNLPVGQIQVQCTFVVSTAAFFPLAAEGNLARGGVGGNGGGGGGGGSGAHWSAEIGIMGLQFLVPDSSGAPVVLTDSDMLPSSDPRPQIQLDPISEGAVTVSGQSLTVWLSGSVTCSVADTVASSSAKIATVQVCVDNDESPAASLTVTWQPDSPTLFRPYAGHGTFQGSITLTLPLPADRDSITLAVIAQNAIEKMGMTCVTVGVNQPVYPLTTVVPEVDADTIDFSVVCQSNFNPNAADTVVAFYGNRDADGTDPQLNETGNDSKVFTGTVEGSSVQLSITNFTGLRDDQTDSFDGELVLSNEGGQLTRAVTFAETGVNTKRFKAAIDVRPGYFAGSVSVTYVRVGEPVEEWSRPIIVEVTGATGILDAQRANLRGGFLDGIWSIEKNEATSNRFVFGTAGKPTAFFIGTKLPGTLSVVNVADGLLMPAPVVAEAWEINNLSKIRAEKDSEAIDVQITHVTGDARLQDCPKTHDDVRMYCFVRSPVLGQAYVVPFGATAPPATMVWGGNYHFRVDNSHQWIDKLDVPKTAVAVTDKRYKIKYSWIEIKPERDTFIHDPGAADGALQGDGMFVAYPTAAPAAGFDKTDIWNPKYKDAKDGVHYYYCQVEVLGPTRPNEPNSPEVTIAHNRSFAPRPFQNCTDRKTGLNPLPNKPKPATFDQADAQARAEARTVVTRMHKVMVGPCTRPAVGRTVAEWAYVHLGLPYGYGAKGFFVNEDCSDLALSCAFSGGALTPNLGYCGAAFFATLGANPQGEAEKELQRKLNQAFTLVKKAQKPFVTLDELTGVPLQPGDMIAHCNFNTPTRFTHIVIISSAPIKNATTGRYTSIPIIEAQGYDDYQVIPQERSYRTDSESMTVSHDYITQYLESAPGARLMAQAAKPYIAGFVVLRLKQQK